MLPPRNQRLNPYMYRSRRHRRGATAVEAALTLPILFLIMLSGWEFSRVNVIRNTMTNAAYIAARESMLPGATAEAARTEGERVLLAIGVANAVIDVTPNNIDADTSEVTVDVIVPLASNSMGIVKFFASRNMTASCTLTRELQPGNF